MTICCCPLIPGQALCRAAVIRPEGQSGRIFSPSLHTNRAPVWLAFREANIDETGTFHKHLDLSAGKAMLEWRSEAIPAVGAHCVEAGVAVKGQRPVLRFLSKLLPDPRRASQRPVCD